MAFGAVVLWLHVLCGVAWVGTCASFVLAASSLTAQPAQWSEFALRMAPRINRINAAAAIAIPLTGIGNLFYAASIRTTAFPPAFIAVLMIKVILYCVMGVMLAASMGAERTMREGFAATGGAEAARRLTKMYGIVAVLGTVALGLGLWLAGT